MKTLFVWITALGLVTVGLHFLGMDLPFLAWIDSWGESVSRGIRAVLVVVGVVVYVVGVNRSSPEHV